MLTPGFNFINIKRAAFFRADPKSAKKIDNFTVFFSLSESASLKAACGMLMKLTPALYDFTLYLSISFFALKWQSMFLRVLENDLITIPDSREKHQNKNISFLSRRRRKEVPFCTDSSSRADIYDVIIIIYIIYYINYL
jgi:hypothetical protein